MPDLLKNTAEMNMYKARLAHLGRLIVRDREPFCAINGLLVLVPIGGTDTEADAQQTAEMCTRDLATLRRVLRLQCPILVLTCDLEALPGFRDFIVRVSARERLGRLGQRFPLASPDLAGEALQEQIDKSIHYLCDHYLRDWVYRLFQVDDTGERDATATNTGLYLFLDEMRGRKKNLSRVLTQGIAREGPVPLLYAGCYLAATGSDKAQEQAFVAGVFKRLLENQSFVAWTDQALAEDRKSHSQANLGYGLLGGLAVVLLATLGFFFLHNRGSSQGP
jgi:type VI protein secretion system component VasK